MTQRTYCDKMFEDTIDAYINSKIKLAIYDTHNVVVEQKVKPNQLAFMMDGIQLTVEDPNHDYIINRIYGMPMDTGDAEEDMLSAGHLYVQPIPIEKAVEVWALTGEIRFATVNDLLTAHEVVDGYHSEVAHRARFSPNFNGIPKEDIEKMDSFLDGTRYLYDLFRGNGVLHSGLAALIQGHTMSVLFDNTEGDNHGLLIRQGSEKTSGKSPYQFSHRG